MGVCVCECLGVCECMYVWVYVCVSECACACVCLGVCGCMCRSLKVGRADYYPSAWHNRFHSDLTLKMTDLHYKNGIETCVEGQLEWQNRLFHVLLSSHFSHISPILRTQLNHLYLTGG